MAGAKLSARQKMINLMYLIFIAMLALNMSKEVLSAFGLMNEKLTESNEAASNKNNDFFANLEQQAIDQPAKFELLKDQATQVRVLANDFNSYLTDLKGKMTATVDNPNDYEIMDKGDYLDDNFFKGEKLKNDGQKFLDEIEKFRSGIIDVIGEKYSDIAGDVKKKFSTEPVTNRDGNVLQWLEYHYKGFPLVASLTKMTQLQADIKTTESEVLSAMLQGTLKGEISMSNYSTLLETTKSAYFNDEQFDGLIVLGRTDKTTKPNSAELTLDGRKLIRDTDYTFEDGMVKLNVSAGRPGEHKIEGKLIFDQDGVPFDVPVSQTFATVPKPNSATISADKMNVVYRGVKNPMTISFAGISDNNVRANASGLTRVKGSKYIIDVTKVKGREVTINVNGTLPGGEKVNDRAKFRIKDLPRTT